MTTRLDSRFNLNDPRWKKERAEMSTKKKPMEEEIAEEDSDAHENEGEHQEAEDVEEAEDGAEEQADEEVEEASGEGNSYAEDDEEAAAAEAERLAEADGSGAEEDSAAAGLSAGEKRRAQLASSGSVKDRTGIVYLSRVPPGMKPAQLRHILGQYGEVGRLYLAPENDAKRKSRKKSGGTARKCFTEGWVEFKRRKVARAVAQTLNNQIMGGDRRAYYYYDMWNIKYLPGFKWHHLTEKIAYEKQMREKRLRTEISQVKRENNLYLERVEKARVAQKIADKRKKKEERDEKANEEETQPTPAPPVTKAAPKEKSKRPAAEGTEEAKAKKPKRPQKKT